MPIDLLDTVTRSVALTNAAGAAVDADTTPTYTITLPDGTPGVAPAVQHGVTGEYYVVYPTTVTGLHRELWTATVASITVVIRREFTVETLTGSFLDTDEAVAHLRASGVITTAADLEQLRWLCQVASEAVEYDLGVTLARRTFTETYDGVSGPLVLRHTPVLSVTSVVENGVTVAPGGWFLDSVGGLLYRGSGTAVTSWLRGLSLITVTYVAGFSDPPRVARKVALNGVERMWQSSQQTAHPALDESLGADLVTAAAGTLSPLEMAAYDRLRSPGIA